MNRLIPLLLFIISGIPFLSQPAQAQNTTYRLIHQGNKYFFARQYDRAANYYMKVLQKDPNNGRATFNLADTYLAKGNAQAADSLFNRVTQLEHNRQVRSMAWHNRGFIAQTRAGQNPQQQQQLLREAIGHYKEALRLNPKDNDTRYNLALCQRQLKKDSQSRQPQSSDKQQQPRGGEQEQNKQSQPQSSKSNPQDKQQTEQYINLAKQAERRALQRLKDQQPRQKSLPKNW